MPLFQNAVLNKYLSGIDEQKAEEAWGKFTAHFHNPVVQQNIREAKEESYQEGFLDDLFVKVLGYTKNPAPNYNLVVEQKNLTDSKKADGALLDCEKVRGVIELKGTETTDLGRVEGQAFGYKNKQPDALYVIISNFEKLRFYIDNAVDFLEFNLFTLTKEEFKVLWLCLGYLNFEKGLPKKIKDASLTEEENVTKKLYKDYSDFKNDIFESIKKHNPEYDKLLLFRKTQKLLDRFLFIFFAEDRLLLPPNSIREIIKQWMDLRDKYDEYVPLYDRFKKYFGYMNEGYKGKHHEIFAYNGGLFAEDEILNDLTIDDDLLYKHAMQLSKYDFDSEVDVNILGHIFEHSLNEIEEITAELEGQEVDTSKTRRKKDGVFYTPKYITKYIVENTVGKLCEEKKTELDIVDEEYRPNRQKKTKKELLDKLEQYREWLLGLTICDPACGSGAFLNQALEFLMEEHKTIDELQGKLLNQPLELSDIETSILENNLFGVDINEESVEIAKLSLWLRTAQKGRKLTSLNNHIKCGNSLIDDPDVAGDKAFNWEEEFPDVFANGGFDVVIGNPPYLRVQGLRENFEIESQYYEKSFTSATGRFDIYVLFIEKSSELINDNGKVSFILPHKFMVSDFGEGIRGFLADNNLLESLIHFGSEMVFEDASTYTCILIISKSNKFVGFAQSDPDEIMNVLSFSEIDYNKLSNEKWNLKSALHEKVFDKLSKQPLKIKDVFENISQGVVSVGDDIYLMKGKIKGNIFKGYSEKVSKEIEIEADIVKPLLKGENVKKYAPIEHEYYVVYPHYEEDGKTHPYEEDEFKKNFPLAYQYFLPFKDELIDKKIRYKTNPTYWYSLHRSREISLFSQEKIITPETSLGGNMTIDYSGYFHNTQVYSLVKNDEYSMDYKYLLAILNSSLFWFFMKNTGTVLRGGYFRFKTKYLEPFPLPEPISKSKQKTFIDKVDKITQRTAAFHNVEGKFIKLLNSKFDIEKLSRKLQSWHELTFKQFLKELKKKKVELSLDKEAEWMEYFNQQKALADELKSQIEQTDREIDKMVYELYGLSGEEVKVVEGSL